MVVHAVFCRIRDDVTEAEIARVFAGLEALVGLVDGLTAYEGGPNIDLENKSPGYTHGFVMRFESREAVSAYATHPAHVAAGGALKAICEGGADGIMVFDLDV